MPDSRPIFRPIVPVYDLLNRCLSLGLDQSWRRHAASHLPRGRVLDVACGTGDLALADAARPGVRVFGTDILSEMLSVAARKNSARRNAAGAVIGWTASAGERLPFRSACFDALTIAFGIRNFVDRRAGLVEMARVLRPGAPLLILEFGVPGIRPIRALYLFYFTRLLPFIGSVIAGNPRSYAYLPETVLAFPEPSDFVDEIAAAGFKNVESESLTMGIVRLYRAARR